MGLFEGFFYHKNSSRQHKVSIRLISSMILITGETVGNLEFSIDDIDIEPRVGTQGHRSINFPDGSTIELLGDELIDSISSQKKTGLNNILYKLESKIHYVAISFALIVGLVWMFFAVGIPYISKTVAYQIPVAVDVKLEIGRAHV